MYDNHQISDRIKSRAKEQKIALKKMLDELDLGINLISHLAKGQNITALNLARIADYLDCSVDYLLGRTDVLEVERGEADALLSLLVRNFGALNEEGQEKLVETSDDFVSSGKYIKSCSVELGDAKMA